MLMDIVKLLQDLDDKNNNERVTYGMLLLEVRSNLRLLDTINLSKEQDVHHGDDAFSKFATLLNYEIIETVLAASEKKSAFWFKTLPFLDDAVEESGSPGERRTVVEVLTAIYLSIQTLRKVHHIDPRLRKNCRLRLRLQNLRSNLIQLQDALEDDETATDRPDGLKGQKRQDVRAN